MDRALAILREKRDVLERSARKLSEKETLDENDLAALVPAAQAGRRSESRRSSRVEAAAGFSAFLRRSILGQLQ
jgi:hypothetical protein